MYEFSVSGRTEIGGNHTDHQGGCILGAAVEQSMHAFAEPSGNDLIHIESEGFGTIEMEIGDTEPKAEEAETPAALARGIMNCFIESGNIFGGFNAHISSNIPAGSGMSSSAAFEVLLGRIISGLYFENSVPPLRIAQFGQIAENDYFGKPCGLMDQLICSLGGTVFVDFSDAEMPHCRKINFDFEESGYSVALIDCGTGHENFTEDYAQIVKDMGLVAWNMGYTLLSEGDEAEFIAQFPILRQRCGERAVMRALHYYEETRRAEEEAEALEAGNFEEFLQIYRESAKSSEEKLKNIVTEKEPGRLLEKAIGAAQSFLGKEGAARVHGGGFGGTAQAIVPTELAPAFADAMEKQGFGVMFVL